MWKTEVVSLPLVYHEFKGPSRIGAISAFHSVTLAADGAQHQITGPTLGSMRDAEVDGLASTTADGDDADANDDEDGVAFASTTFVAAATVNVQSAPGGAKLDAWIDFNGDGSFDGPGEQIASSLTVAEGDNLVSYVIPDGTVPGETYARFRLSSTGGLAPTGMASDGEVEDYVVTVIPVDTPYYQHTESFAVGYGVVGEGSLPAEIGEDYLVRGSKVYYRQGNEWYVTDASHVETPAEEGNYRTTIEGDTLVIQQLVDGEWLAAGEWTLPDDPGRYDIRFTRVDGDTIAVMARDPGAPWKEDDFSNVYLIEQVDGVWQAVYTIRRAYIDQFEFKNGTLGISLSGFYYDGGPSHDVLASGYVALVRKFEGEWIRTTHAAEVFDQLSHVIPDYDDGFGTGCIRWRNACRWHRRGVFD